jgi:CheY-like chemotaxis protein
MHLSEILLLSENRTRSFFAVPTGKSMENDRTPSPRVLVVDNDPLIADTLVEILNEHGFIAEAVYGGAEAIEVAKSICPEIVLSDVLMPEVNGVEAAIAIRKLCPVTRIVLFSGQAATAELLADAREQGYSFDQLPKPVHPSKLLEMLRQ